ncbi:MAG: hypothetical protein GY778_13690 [bacterium]|nr:hypothetical protein [bacterium]
MAKQAPTGNTHILLSRAQFDATMQAVEAVQRTQGRRPGDLAGRPVPSGVVMVRNDSVVDVGRHGVLGIDGVLIEPQDDEDEFTARVLLSGLTPDPDLHAGKFVVLLEPGAPGDLGRAVIDGVVQVQVKMIDEAHGYADVADADNAKLESGATGPAQLLWVQSVSDRSVADVAWCVVRLGGDRIMPPAYKTVADESEGEIDVKRVNADGTTTGEAETWQVFSE